LPSINDINYFLLLNNEFEKKLCQDYLFKYQSIFDELHESINLNNSSSEKSLQVKLNTTKLFKFLVDLSNLVSKYYSKIHILEDPKFKHLHAKMTARIYLIKSIYNLIRSILNLFGVEAIKRI
jgi:arginyl-tRNA synthetase